MEVMNQQTEETTHRSAQPPIEALPGLRLQRATLWCAGLFGFTAVVAVALAAKVPNPLFAGIGVFLGWCLLASVTQYLFLRFDLSARRKAETPDATTPPGVPDSLFLKFPWLLSFAGFWQWCLLATAWLAVVYFFHPIIARHDPLSAAAPMLVRSATVIYLAFGCVIFFFANFLQAMQARIKTNLLNPILILARIAGGFCFAASGLSFLFLSFARDYSAWLGWPLLFVAMLLAAEPIFRLSYRFYQPRELRLPPRPVGNSLLLDTLFGQGHDLRAAVLSFEKLSGMKLSEMWMIRFFRETIGVIILGALLLGWLSTCFTAIPAGSRGVKMLLGRYDQTPLQPGLHVTLPWPLEQIEIVETERVRSFSLGFDKDTGYPELWNETHFEGEKNLLAGNGETLLSINVPILYRVKDPVAYLQASTDPEQALVDLAQQKLLVTMESRDSFSIMLEDRSSIASTLSSGLQKEFDQLNFGVELVFVGLQDVHPPVTVAPAYQNVVSAQEEKETLIDKAQAARAVALTDAKAKAATLTIQATANATAQVATAQGATTYYFSLAAEDKTDLLRARLRFDALQDALAKPSKIIIGIPSSTAKQFYLDLRNPGGSPPP
jgi:regulator of protease activity HflC (stomatin/prohibitin superfamily)